LKKKNSGIPDLPRDLNDDFVSRRFAQRRRGVMTKSKVEKAENEKSEKKEKELLAKRKMLHISDLRFKISDFQFEILAFGSQVH
jgi:hypothetical protein